MHRSFTLAAALILAALSTSGDDFESQRHVIEEIRGLRFVRPVETTAITRSQFRDELRERLGEGLPVPLEDYLHALEALQLIPGKAGAGREGVIGQLIDLYEQQVLAFYDPIRHRYYSISDGPGLSLTAAMDEAVVIHELTHALQDQVFDAGRKFEALKTDADGQLAYQAVLEGEATLVMLASVYRSLGKTLDDLVNDDSVVGMLNSGAAVMNMGRSGVPAYFLHSLKFPYVEGFQLVLAAYKKGGWDEVSRLHGNRSPTTEAVIHPAPFLNRKSSAPPFRMKQRTERCCRTLLATRLGEFHWRFLVGGDAAQGWADDFVVVLSDPEGRTTVLIDTEWDRAQDASEFVRAYERYLGRRKVPFSSRVSGKKARFAWGEESGLIERFTRKGKR